jgi:hypothetical protein
MEEVNTATVLSLIAILDFLLDTFHVYGSLFALRLFVSKCTVACRPSILPVTLLRQWWKVSHLGPGQEHKDTLTLIASECRWAKAKVCDNIIGQILVLFGHEHCREIWKEYQLDTPQSIPYLIACRQIQ